jgi:hypothetical protein
MIQIEGSLSNEKDLIMSHNKTLSHVIDLDPIKLMSFFQLHEFLILPVNTANNQRLASSTLVLIPFGVREMILTTSATIAGCLAVVGS